MQTIDKLQKTNKSLIAHIARGNGQQGQRSTELAHRYNDLRDELTQKDYSQWEAYCNAKGYDVRHDAWDHFA